MPEYIVQKGDAYNVFSSVVDAFYFEPALTLDELRKWYRRKYGQHGMDGLQQRLERASAKGTSSIIDIDLRDCIQCNRAGPKGTELSYDECIERFLTLKAASIGLAKEAKA